MNAIDGIFDGLFGYERLMLICGFVLFVFALAAIMVMIVQRRDFKVTIVLIVFAIVLMGFPGIQAVKFSKDMVELDRIRTRPTTAADPVQQQQAQQTLGELEQRAAGNLRLQAKVSDGYRAIGEVDKAYWLAQAVLRQNPPARVRATLVPVLTAKLNQVQSGAPIAAPAAPSPSVSSSRQREIAAIARQLQQADAQLPAASHAALAKAYVVLGQPQKAQANVEAARRIDPNIRISPAVLRATKRGGDP